MNQRDSGTFDRRGRELGLAARPLLILSRCPHRGNHTDKNQNKKPLTQISLQSRVVTCLHTSFVYDHTSFVYDRTPFVCNQTSSVY